MTDRRNTPENTANDTIQSPFPQYSPKMPEMEENPTVQPHFADFGLTSAPNETNAAKATVQRLFGRFQGILGQIRRPCLKRPQIAPKMRENRTAQRLSEAFASHFAT